MAFEFDDDDRPLLIEDDRRACYGSVRGPLGKIVCGAWLYNRVTAPEDADPKKFTAHAAPANPRMYAHDWADGPLPWSAADFHASMFKATNTPTAFSIFIRGEVFAILRAGEELGMSKLARKDGPLALRLPPPGDAYLQAIHPYWDRVVIARDGDSFLRTFAQVPEPAGHLLAAQACEAEVCNGGFHQFFTNPTGVLAPEATRAFRVIGKPDMADLVERAMAVFAAPYPREQEERLRVLDAIPGKSREQWDPFCALDNAFYAALADAAFYDAADAYATLMMPNEARLNLTPEPQIPGRLSYVRLGLPE